MIPKPQFSLFRNLGDITPETVTLDQFAGMVTGGKWQQEVSAVRAITDEAKQKTAKKTLPAVTVSGIFLGGHKKSNLQQHSGLICMDFDLSDNPQLAESAESLKKQLQEDKFSKLAFVSVRGKGLAVICEIDPEQHKASFDELSRYYLAEYGLKADKGCHDVSRLRFVSWDADAELNERTGGVSVTTKALHSTKEKDTRVLGDYDTTVLCNKSVPTKLEKIGKADRYTEAFEALPCHSLYEKLVRRQFRAKKGERNTILTHKIIPFLFGAVKESVAMQFAEAYYWYNAGIFPDPIEDHMKEARAAWKSCNTNYRDGLTESEQQYFDYLGTVKKAEHLIPLFRICRSLAIGTIKRHPYGLFDLSGEQCRFRLGLDHNEQGKRMLETFGQQCGVLDIERHGEPRSKAFPSGIANVYRWLIENPSYPSGAETIGGLA